MSNKFHVDLDSIESEYKHCKSKRDYKHLCKKIIKSYGYLIEILKSQEDELQDYQQLFEVINHASNMISEVEFIPISDYLDDNTL